MIKILVDSSSDYSPSEVREKGLLFVPIQISLADKQYRDGIDLERDQFYEMLEESGEFPKTSQPSPQAFLDIFQEAQKNKDQVICILLSSKLSGTYQSALLASQMINYEGTYLVDSLTAACTIQLLADHALELVASGLGAEEIVERLESLKSRAHVVAMLDTLEYLRRGGRIGKAAAVLGELARLKPIITLSEEGEIAVVGKAVGKNKAICAILKRLEEHPADERFPIYTGYTYGTENCEAFEERLQKEQIPVSGRRQIGATIGAHVGPGVFGILYVEKE